MEKKSLAYKLVLGLLALLIIATAIYRIFPSSVFWQYPLAPHSYNNHHMIISAISDLYENPNHASDDLVIQAAKQYFVPYRYIQIFFVNILHVDLMSFVDAMIVAAVLLNIAGLVWMTYSVTGSVTLGLLAASIFVAAPEITYINDVQENFQRCLAQGISLISLGYFFRHKHLHATLINASGCLFHYGMSIYLMLMYVIYFAISWRSLDKKKTIIAVAASSALIGLLMSEGILMTLTSFIGAPPRSDAAVGKFIVVGTAGTTWSLMLVFDFLRFVLSKGVYTMALDNFFINRLLIPILVLILAPLDKEKKRTFFKLYLAFIVLAAIHFIGFDILYSSTLVRLILLNASYFIPPLMVLVLCASVADAGKAGAGWSAISRTAAVAVLIFAGYYMLGNYSMARLFSGALAIKAIVCAAVLIIAFPAFASMAAKSYTKLAAFIAGSVIISLFFTTMYLDGVRAKQSEAPDYAELITMEQWIKKNTPEDAEFLFYGTLQHVLGLRIYAKRSVIVQSTWDLHIVEMLTPANTKAALRQFTALWDVQKIDGVPVGMEKFDMQRLIRFPLWVRSADDFMRIKQQYPKLAYVVAPIEIKGMTLLFSNKHYNLYGLPKSSSG